MSGLRGISAFLHVVLLYHYAPTTDIHIDSVATTLSVLIVFH